MFLPADHPKQLLLFFIDSELNDTVVQKMRLLVEQLSEQHDWLIDKPTFCDESDTGSDESIRTVGGFLEIYSALPPWNEQLPCEVDAAHLKEVKVLVRALEVYSKETESTVALELDNVQIGWIEAGVSDSGIKETFLEEWEQNLKKTQSLKHNL
ncbi:MAG: hypothetical protein ACTS2F_11370 [Thainema sp.]